MIRRGIRHIKEGFIGVGRNAAMSISSASAVTITLILISVFILLTLNLQNITKDVEGDIKIIVFIDRDFEEQGELDRIEGVINSITNVTSVSFSSKEAEYEIFLNLQDEESRAFYNTLEGDNPMRDVFSVEVLEGSMIEGVTEQISAIEGVNNANYGGDSAVMIVDTMETIRLGGSILVVALSFLAIYLVQNTIKLTILARNKEIWIMRNVGARNGFIRAPFVIEGVIIGALGAVVPCVLTVFGYIYIFDLTGGVIISNVFALIEPHPFVLYVCLLLMVIGMLVGFVGSFLSVTKYLRWKR